MQTLDQYLQFLVASPTHDQLRSTMLSLAKTAVEVHHAIRVGSIVDHRPAAENASGETQKSLDVFADEAFLAAAKASPVWLYGSEEQEAPIPTGAGNLVLAIDPLDGSSNIETNIAVGTIFSLFAVDQTVGPEQALSQHGRNQLAAGFFIYGAQLLLVFTAGKGTHSFIYDPAVGSFRHQTPCAIPPRAGEYSINASNRRHWYAGMGTYIADIEKGRDGPRQRDFGMRYAGSLVADCYRILQRGGVFIYPPDRRKGHERGRLRQLYEANPIAFCIEQAGGVATDLGHRLLDLPPGPLHGRIPLAFGSREEMEIIACYTQADPCPALTG